MQLVELPEPLCFVKLSVKKSGITEKTLSEAMIEFGEQENSSENQSNANTTFEDDESVNQSICQASSPSSCSESSSENEPLSSKRKRIPDDAPSQLTPPLKIRKVNQPSEEQLW